MKTYHWKARSREGGSLQGEVWADSRNEAGTLLKEQYAYVLQLREIPFWQRPLGGRKKLNLEEKEIFFQQLGILLQGGIPVLRALHMMGLDSGPKTGNLCRMLEKDLSGGFSLSQSFFRHAGILGQLAGRLAEAGEKNGMTGNFLIRLSGYYKLQRESRKAVVQAALYPLLVLGMTFLTALVFCLKVLPVFWDVMQTLHMQPPFLFRVLAKMGIWGGGEAAGGILLCLLAGSIPVVLWKCRSVFLERIPWCRKFWENFWEIRYVRLLALLLQGGVGLEEALPATGKILPESPLFAKVKSMESRVLSGVSLAEAAAACPALLGSLTREFMAIGQESGTLPELLEEAAGMLERNFQGRMKTVRTLLEPVFLLILAGGSGILLYLMMSPLLSMMNDLPVMR